MPSSKIDLQSRHPDNENHQEKNYERQQRQAEAYDRKASIDKRILNNMEPVYVRNTIKKIWEPCVASSIDQTLLESQELTLLI